MPVRLGSEEKFVSRTTSQSILTRRSRVTKQSDLTRISRVIPPKAEGITSLLRLPSVAIGLPTAKRVAAMAEEGRLAGTPLLCGGIRVQGLSLTLQSFRRRPKPVEKASSK